MTAPEAARPRVGVLAHQLDGDLTGVGRYMASLLVELCNRDHGVDVVPLVVGPIGVLEGQDAVGARLPADRTVSRALDAVQRAARLRGHRAALLTVGSAAAAIAARRLSLDVLHDLTGLAPFVVPARARGVITVHDLISYLPDGTNDLADDLVQRHWLPRAARRVDAIITVSATTGHDVEHFLGVPSDRVHVAHHGVDPRFRVLESDVVDDWLHGQRLSPGYVLFVGSASPRKNLPALVNACRRLWSAGVNAPLVVAGPARVEDVPGAHADIAAGRIRSLGYVAEPDLPALYNAAAVLAYPSSYEGFGLPALEAMSCGTPVVAGRGGALSEVIGSAGVLVAPTDDDEIAHAIGRILSDESHRCSLREHGLRHAQHFTWSATASRTVAVYRQIAGRR